MKLNENGNLHVKEIRYMELVVMNNISIYKRKADLKLKPTTNRTEAQQQITKSTYI